MHNAGDSIVAGRWPSCARHLMWGRFLLTTDTCTCSLSLSSRQLIRSERWHTLRCIQRSLEGGSQVPFIAACTARSAPHNDSEGHETHQRAGLEMNMT